jgi:5-methylthioadenosine/S-adenosylhomocysteine deaminase
VQDCDLLVSRGLVVDAHEGIRPDTSLVVQGSRIVEVGPSAALAARYRATCQLDATDRIVLPGLVNAHTHASSSLFRGYAPDVSGEGFFDRMWRIEALLSEEDVYIGALAGCLEMIQNGVTGFANHFSHMDQVARAVEQSGMRAGLSRTMLDRGDSSRTEREVGESLGFAERWATRCSRIRPMLGPHAAYTCSDGLLRRAAEEARRSGLTLHTHIAESPYERDVMLKRSGVTTVQHLERLDFFGGNRVLGAHALLLDDADLDVLGRADFHAAICTTGKMNRGQGIADLSRLLGAGINVCLGTDGSASDNLDVLMGMKVTHIAQNYLQRRPSALPPERILEMATTNAGRALGWEIGRIAPGQLADFILVDARRTHLRPLITEPRSNVLFNLVYYATGADVDTVVVDGQVIMEGRRVSTLDAGDILDRLQDRAQRLWEGAAQGADGGSSRK